MRTSPRAAAAPMASALVLGLLGLALAACCKSPVRAVGPARCTEEASAAETPRAPMKDTATAWDRARFLAFCRQEPDYAVWVEDVLWQGLARASGPLQPLPISLRSLPMVMQYEPGILRWRLARPTAHITLNLRPGRVSAVQVERFTLDRMGALESPWSIAAVVDPGSRASRVVLIRGTKERPWDPAQVRTLLAVEGAAFTGFTIDRKRGRLYVLDAQGWRVWRIEDTDGDGVPDHPASDAVVPPRLFTMRPEDLPITSIAWLERDGIRGLLPLEGAEHAGALWGAEESIQGARIWQDTDDDGVMDTLGTWSEE